jgi:hypothetical protein
MPKRRFDNRLARPRAAIMDIAQLCRAPDRASRKNLKALIERHQWLQNLPDPTAALQALADSKVLQWANAAKRLKAPALIAVIAPNPGLI